MNVFNRVMTILLLVLVIGIALPVAVTPEGVALFVATGLQQVQISTFSLTHLFVVIGTAVLVIVCLILLRLEFRRPGRKSVSVAGAGNTSAELATESIAERLKHEVEALPQVRQVLPVIVSHGKALDVRLEVRTDHDVDVPAKAGEVDRVVRETMSSLGLNLRKLQTRIVTIRGSSSQPAGDAAPQ